MRTFGAKPMGPGVAFLALFSLVIGAFGVVTLVGWADAPEAFGSETLGWWTMVAGGPFLLLGAGVILYSGFNDLPRLEVRPCEAVSFDRLERRRVARLDRLGAPHVSMILGEERSAILAFYDRNREAALRRAESWTPPGQLTAGVKLPLEELLGRGLASEKEILAAVREAAQGPSAGEARPDALLLRQHRRRRLAEGLLILGLAILLGLAELNPDEPFDWRLAIVVVGISMAFALDEIARDHPSPRVRRAPGGRDPGMDRGRRRPWAPPRRPSQTLRDHVASDRG